MWREPSRLPFPPGSEGDVAIWQRSVAVVDGPEVDLGELRQWQLLAPEGEYATLPVWLQFDGGFSVRVVSLPFRIVRRFQKYRALSHDPEVALPPPPPPVVGEGADFIIGPQVPLGQSPWTFYDSNLVAFAQTHRDAALISTGAQQLNAVYYDLALALYGLAKRSGDPAHTQLAVDVADWWWQTMPARVAWEPYRSPFAITPRNSSLGGLLIYALSGGGTVPLTFERGPDTARTYPTYTLWQWLTAYIRQGLQNWVTARLNYASLYFGIRDGGYMLIYAAWLAKVHPDPAVRAEFQAKALTAATGYYIRLQYPDGGWYWKDGGPLWEQPFEVGLLLEALIAIHLITNDATVRTSILKAVDHLWSIWRIDTVPEMPAVQWRQIPYFRYPDGTWQGETHLAGGWDTNTIREGRQRNSLIVHAFGYAYQLTGDPKYKIEGDEVFAATYGHGQGPGADAFYGLADFRAKEYNQAYRSAGRYLGWR